MSSYENIREAVIQKKLENPQQQAIESQMAHRRYIAEEFGRIIPEGIPDFVGNFSESNSSNGIFEMYISSKDEKGNFLGIIEDCYGTATVGGTISDQKEIAFHKKYIPERSSADTIQNSLIYQGQYDPLTRSYIGKFSINDYPRCKHPFVLTEDLLKSF